MKQANTYEEIEPLIKLCKTGRLFEVQDWISSGKPVNLPPAHALKRAKQSPLQVAIELGFHSLVQVLLEGGSSLEDPRYPPLIQALHKKRLDFIKLLVEHGADIHTIPMEDVFASWNNEIVDFFIEKGADLEKGYPLAQALCWKIRPA
ncbi:MAG: ankyrin repeat domain-containing protein, partial [Syntrophales bacterium]